LYVGFPDLNRSGRLWLYYRRFGVTLITTRYLIDIGCYNIVSMYLVAPHGSLRYATMRIGACRMIGECLNTRGLASGSFPISVEPHDGKRGPPSALR
jgi:hypothetical protein